VIRFGFEVPPKVECQRAVGQAPNFEVDAYMECYVYAFPSPRLRQVFFILAYVAENLKSDKKTTI